jgi:DNA-binding NarL/FixJ family response regulator
VNASLQRSTRVRVVILLDIRMCAGRNRESIRQPLRIQKPRVLLADDHALVVAAITKLLGDEFDIVGAVGDGRTLLEVAPEVQPDVVLLDLSIPLLHGMEAGDRLKKLLPETKIIVLTMSDDPGVAAEALRTWASGFVLKNAGTEELARALKEAVAGGAYVSSALRAKLHDPMIRGMVGPDTQRLTPRQREVLQLLAEGHSMKQAADLLHVSARTIAFHKYKIMAALGLRTNSELLRFAIREGIVKLA